MLIDRLRLELAKRYTTVFNRSITMNALEVAEYLIQKAANPASKGKAKILTPLKLQKILYFAQGWYLANTSKPLFREKIWAWKYGPVVKEVYNEYKRYGDKNLANAATQSTSQPIQEKRDFLDNLWDKYGGETAEDLVTATHNSDPWLDAFSNPYTKEITQASIRRYFETLLN